MQGIKDKFNLSREDNIFIAKKYLKDSVYRSAHLEGLAVTFPQTEAILENAAVSGVSPKDISKVFGLRDAWEYVLNNIDKEVDLVFLEELHQLIAKEDVPWDYLGVLRKENVRISGATYVPEIPDADKILKKIQEIGNSEISDTDKAVSTLLYLMRAQPFLDGNKRVSTLACNKMLIATGHGIFSVPPELKQEFSEKLVHFYETNEADDIKNLIFDKCLTGM